MWVLVLMRLNKEMDKSLRGSKIWSTSGSQTENSLISYNIAVYISLLTKRSLIEIWFFEFACKIIFINSYISSEYYNLTYLPRFNSSFY